MNEKPVITTEPTTPQPEPSNNLLSLLVKSMAMTAVVFLGLVSVSLIIIIIFVYRYYAQFAQASGLSWSESKQLMVQALETRPIVTNHHKTILLLGTDSLVMRGNVPPLTDTIQLISINLDTAQIISLSLPRDIYSAEYQTKINALYAYGFERSPDQPEDFPHQVIADLTGQQIHHTLVISLDQLGELIDLVGGVKIEVPTGFVDEEFPRTGADLSSLDPGILYERVEFVAGEELMTSDRALKYIRSRHAPGEAGTDLARSARQQQVIESLLVKLMSVETFLDPKSAGQLFKYYQTNFNRYLPVSEVLSTALVLIDKRDKIQFNPHQLSLYPEDPQGVLFNPPVTQYDGQWVYEIKDLTIFQRQVNYILTSSEP